MGKVMVGDKLFDENGEVCTVTFKSDIHNIRCYEVIFDDGTRVVTDCEHKWFTQTKLEAKRNRQGGIRTTPEIAKSLRYGKDGRETNHRIACAKPLQCKDRELPIDPYVLGIWLGDGCSEGGAIESADLEVIHEIELRGYSCKVVPSTVGKSKSSRYRVEGLTKTLRRNSLQYNKHIPAYYLRASIEQRRALLAGLVDSDGFIGCNGIVEYTSVNQRLAKDVCDLALTLGYKAKTYNGRATLNGVDCGSKYRVSFSFDEPIPFLARKLARCRFPGEMNIQARRRFIREVNEIPSVPTQCIQVNSKSHQFLCSRALIPTHNTTALNYWLARKIRDAKGPCSIGLVSQSITTVDRNVLNDQNMGLFNAFANILPGGTPAKQGVPGKVAFKKKDSRTGSYTFSNGVTLYLLSAENPDAIRGANLAYCAVDELLHYSNPEYIFSACIDYAVRVGSNPQIFIATTPNRKTSFQKKLLGLPNAYYIRGTNAENPYGKKKQFKAGSILSRLDREEAFGEVIDDVGAYFANIQRTQDVPANLDRIVVGVDPCVSESDSATTGIVVCGVNRVDGVLTGYVLEDASVPGSPDTWARAVVEAYDRWNADRVVCEVNQGGAMVEHTLRQVRKNLPISTVHASRGKATRAEPISALYEQGRIFHVGSHPLLEDQLECFDPLITNYKRNSPDRLDAMVWAFTSLMIKKKGVKVRPLELPPIGY